MVKKLTKNSLEFEHAINQLNRKQEEVEEESSISVICMNLTQSKYYVYDTNGILQNRINYNDIADKYGQPISTSSNGQYFVFKNSFEHVSNLNDLTWE